MDTPTLPRRLRLAPLLTAVAFALPLVLAATPASSHDLPRERTLLVQCSPGGIEVMALYLEPPGDPVRLLLARFDFDRNGELDGLEAFTAASEWTDRALRGLEFRVGGDSLNLDDPRVKFRRKHNGALGSALWFRRSWTNLEPGESRTLTVSRSAGDADYTTLVSFQRTKGLAFRAIPGGSRSARVGPYRLDPGESLGITLERPESRPHRSDR